MWANPGTVGVQGAVLDRRERRENLDVSAGGQIDHALQNAHLREEARLVSRHRRPNLVLLILRLDLSNDLEPPAVLLIPSPLGVSQALEGDRHLCRIAVLHDLTASLEQCVPRAIRVRNGTPTPTPCADDTVALHPISVDVEVVPPLLVHEGVEVDRHEIVRGRPVTIHPVRSHDRGILIMRIKPEVDIFRVVGDVDLGLLRRGGTVEGSLLHELGDQGCRSPHFIVEAAVDFRRRVDAGWTHRRTVGNQTVILYARFFYDRGSIFTVVTLVLPGRPHRHQAQHNPHHQGHMEPCFPGTLTRPLGYEHTHHTPRIRSK